MAEKEYIEREKALDSLLGWAERLTETYGKNDEYVLCLQSAAYNIEQIPAADVRPVVKARWVYTDMSRLVCSNCGNPVTFALKDDGWHHGDYCPNCGARMEES